MTVLLFHSQLLIEPQTLCLARLCSSRHDDIPCLDPRATIKSIHVAVGISHAIHDKGRPDDMPYTPLFVLQSTPLPSV